MDEKEKAIAYDKALERAKLAIKECGDNKGRISMIEAIFPELSEWDAEKKELNQLSQSEVTKTSEQVWSEDDEKISENILNHLREYYVQKKGYPYVADLNSPEMEEFRWFKTFKDKLKGENA